MYCEVVILLTLFFSIIIFRISHSRRVCPGIGLGHCVFFIRKNMELNEFFWELRCHINKVYTYMAQ
jgi:hypothetical protein